MQNSPDERSSDLIQDETPILTGERQKAKEEKGLMALWN